MKFEIGQEIVVDGINLVVDEVLEDGSCWATDEYGEDYDVEVGQVDSFVNRENLAK